MKEDSSTAWLCGGIYFWPHEDFYVFPLCWCLHPSVNENAVIVVLY